MGAAKPRMGALQPHRKIVGEHVETRYRRDEQGIVIGTLTVTVEELECGHTVDQVSRSLRAPVPVRRMCHECKGSVDPALEPETIARRTKKERERRARLKGSR